MSQTNVIITSGSKNQIIHVPVVTSTSRSGTPFEVVTTSKANITINRTNDKKTVNNSYHNYNNANNVSNRYSPQNSFNRSSHSSTSLPLKFETFNDDNCEVKTLYVNRNVNDSREQLLLPKDTYIKQEEIDEDEEYEEYESYDGDDSEGMDERDSTNAKTQYKCSGCGKGFCYTGWLDRHKLSNPSCRNAQAIKESVVYTPATSNNADKARPSLEGRREDLLHCPNENCTFASHWVQSLNKHVFSSCKFGKDKAVDNSTTISSNKKSLHACHLCSKGFSDTEEHIHHMKRAHQIKLFYQCSQCKLNFDNKVDSEAHIKTHNHLAKNSTNEKKATTPGAVTSKKEMSNGMNNGMSVSWVCDLCNNRYLSERSYEIHRTSCTQTVPTERHSQSQQNTSFVKPQAKRALSVNDNSLRHFKREQIEAIHIKDFRCKYCRKIFDTSFGLCNHLSRRPFCREWYYSNIEFELKKNNSLHLMNSKRKRHFDNSSASPVSGPPVSRRTSLTQRSISYHTGTNSARCNQCRKVFVGKNPTVALTNHLRGSTCNSLKCNSIQKPEVIKSRTLNTISQTVSENRFYCKLCPRIELKNRVSLGCHLTIYHALPQVNVSTQEGDAFRCQNCTQVFYSKYFYNLHRQDCDLTSDYIGIISDNTAIQSEKANTGHQSSSLVCDHCNRNGFSNEKQLNIHQKYQCIRRHQLNKTQPTLKRFTNQKTVFRDKAVPMEEVILSNDVLKPALNQTMCDACGRGPFNSYQNFMEHKKKYCNALRAPTKHGGAGASNKAKKSLFVNTTAVKSSNKQFCLNPTIPRARKTMNFANVSSPQISHDSSAQMESNENDSEEVVVSVSEVTLCSICKEEFDDILQFIRHRLSHISDDIMQNESVDALECELCGARVHHYQRIQQHLILHLQNVQILKKKNLIEISRKNLKLKPSDDGSDDEEDDETDSPLLHCPYCKSEYKSRIELAEHIKKTCPSRYQCPTCSNTYSAKDSYLEHKDICSKNAAISKIASKAPTYRCRNCSLEFRIKQQLLWHEHACNKIYTSDHSGRVDEVIERTLSCSVCGLISDLYERKVRHESQCLKRYLAVIGNSTEDFKSNGEQMAKPLSPMDFNLTSLSNTSESSEVPEELINNLKHEFGIQKEVKVVLIPFDEEVMKKLKNELYCETDESVQYLALKESFMALVRRLTKNDASVLQEMSRESSAEVLLVRMLRYLGEEAVEDNGLNELNCFRQNLQTFLKLTIKDDTLILAYRDAESVDEAVINMLNFECELHC